jgi:hypothetical protein
LRDIGFLFHGVAIWVSNRKMTCLLWESNRKIVAGA